MELDLWVLVGTVGIFTTVDLTFFLTLKPFSLYVALLWALGGAGGQTVAEGVTPALAPLSRSTAVDSSWFSSSGTASSAVAAGSELPDFDGEVAGVITLGGGF